MPHRVVCLVGLDDGVFPRLSHPDGDDVLAREPMTGERDIRSEDRQLLLDAIGAATQTLVITYTGADERTGQPRPPAVPLAELLDALDQTTSAPVRERILVTHPLQPFDRKNVTPGALLGAKPFTFDPAALAAAQAAAGKRCPPTAFISGRLPAPPAADVTLADLLDFFKDPVKGFFRALDYTLPWDVDTVEDSIPVQVDAWPSGRWASGCCATCSAACTPTTPLTPNGVAARCRPGASACDGRRKSGTARAIWRPPRWRTATATARRTTSTSTSATGGD